MSEIERMNPGLVVRGSTRPGRGMDVTLTNRSRKALLRDVGDRVRRGELAATGAMRYSSVSGTYAVDVTLIDRPRAGVSAVVPGRRMRDAALLCFGVAAIVASLAWFLQALSMISLAGVCVALLGGLVLVLVVSRPKSSGGSVTVVSNINVRR